MKIALGQANPTVGDIKGNTRHVIRFVEMAKREDADIVALPELMITGYPPQDLLYERQFVRANKDALGQIATATSGIVAIVGFVDYDERWRLYNAAAVFQDGDLVHIVHKTLLPTYDVFDEDRYFEPQPPSAIHPVEVPARGVTVSLGVEICEDLWDDAYETKVTDILCQRGAQLVINISSSPFHVGKKFERERLVTEKAKRNHVPVFLVNLVGGQDELVFDGQSFGADSRGEVILEGPAFEEALVTAEIDLETGAGVPVERRPYCEVEEMFGALVLGLRDYFRKTGFERAVLGLSGGIDSSVTACIAAEALGPENVIGVSMPSRFSSDHSKTDAELLAENLGIKFVRIPIQEIVDKYHETLEAPLEEIRFAYGVDRSQDDPVADENIQPRVRGNCLMDISNRLKDLRILVLNTGNKTELALGYCTLYGDMTGGVGVIGDVSKLEVYRLAEYINRRAGREVIPRSCITKRPSAELRENQYDPFDFDIVSPLVDEIVENRRGRQELIEMGYPPDVVDDVYSRIRRAEYKRWQAPPCIKITRKAFGIGWKMPIVNKYRG
ncbi:MAG: NAD+ synthase [Candidatus Thorarchaeota archaeon]